MAYFIKSHVVLQGSDCKVIILAIPYAAVIFVAIQT